MDSIHNIGAIFRRELKAYFESPVAYVFTVVFLLLTGFLTFSVARFYERGVADLTPFFFWHPWVYLLLVPAATMSLWAEERRSGTVELLLTMPITMFEAIIGKFLAAWLFCGVALVATMPLWVTVNVLGVPDNGVVFASYLASFLMAGAFLAIGSAISAVTSNQVVAFVVSAAVCFVITVSSLDMVLDAFRGWAPDLIIDSISSISFLNHFMGITRGVIALGDVVFFASMIGLWLFINVVVVDVKKGS